MGDLPTPRGVTAPIPVTTTRLIAQLLGEYCEDYLCVLAAGGVGTTNRNSFNVRSPNPGL